jgi:hypothetical protein
MAGYGDFVVRPDADFQEMTDSQIGTYIRDARNVETFANSMQTSGRGVQAVSDLAIGVSKPLGALVLEVSRQSNPALQSLPDDIAATRGLAPEVDRSIAEG